MFLFISINKKVIVSLTTDDLHPHVLKSITVHMTNLDTLGVW